MTRISAVVALSLLAMTCTSRSKEPIDFDAGIQPRVFDPPQSKMRAVPPHHVHQLGIGPYELGAPLKKVLETLPHGPRIELFRLGRLADFSLSKSENGGLLVGIERDVGVRFIAALAEKIAQTAGGAGVGSPVEDVAAEFGPVLRWHNTVGDPRLRRHRDLEGVVFISGLSSTRAPHVGAIVVDRMPPADDAASQVAGRQLDCAASESAREGALAAARLGGPVEVEFHCEGGNVVGAVVYGGRRVTWVASEKEKFRRGGSAATGNLSFAAPLSVPDEGGIHVVAVTSTRTVSELTIALDVWRVEASRLLPVVSGPIYSLSKNEITWVGGSLASVDVAVEVALSGSSELVATGFYIERSGDAIAMVAPLAAQTFSVKRRVTAPPGAADAAATDTDAIDGGVPSPAKDAGARERTRPTPPKPKVEAKPRISD